MISLQTAFRQYFPGIAIAAVVALSAQFLADHYGAPAMLMAILIGLALNFLGEEPRSAPGIALTARHVLRLGVALLGIRVSTDTLIGLGPGPLAIVALAVPLTIGFGLVLARLLDQPGRFGFLTGGSVAICGASAAMAIGALLPQDARRERDIAFTVIAVTVMSTLAMILYPILAARLALPEAATGLLLGATIHDVAQVVGAGFSVSPEVGDLSTLFKLFRVMLLAPVVVIGAVILRRSSPQDGPRPPLMPGFVLAFLLLAGANSLGLVPEMLRAALDPMIRASLLMAVAAVGLRTHLPALLTVGPAAAVMIVTETLFLLAIVLAALLLI
ncbi:YeiH family protein [Gemmobacter denitrificans]|uniref:Sulfate exporter family transporter n=1 Tax=Gemmobacter denitrificans TaxID=3123040 RepID=A0ABU8C021_9RHOB